MAKTSYMAFRKQQGLEKHAEQVRNYTPESGFYQVGFNMAMHDLIERTYLISTQTGDYSPVLLLEMWAERPYNASLDGKLDSAKQQLLEKGEGGVRDILMMYLGCVRNPLVPERSHRMFYKQIRKELSGE